MHYLLVISSLTAGGAERVLTRLANRWAEQGHHVSIIPFKRLPSFYHLDERIQCVWLPESPVRWLKLFFFFLKIIMFRYHVWRLKPDRVLSFLDKTNLVTLFALWRQGYDISVSERIDPRRYYIHPLWRWLRHKLYPTAQHVIVQTPSIAAYFPYPTLVIPNPVVPANQHAEIRPQATRLMTVGRLDSQKDHITLIRAVALLIKEHPNIHLTIYGEGVERSNLEHVVRAMQLTEHVALPGLSSHIEEALLASDIFVFPSLYEGFPNALCEAMAHGMPVVASDIPGNNDVIEDKVNGRLFPVGQPEALASIIADLLKDQHSREIYGKGAILSMQKYDPNLVGLAWDHVMK